MQRWVFAAILFSCAGLLVAPVAVSGQQPNDQQNSKQQKRQRTVRGKVSGEVDQFLKKYDKDKDGKIQQDELPARLSDEFDVLDRNGDGALDRQELEKHAMSMQRRLRPEEMTIVWIFGADREPPTLKEVQKAYTFLRKIDKDNDGKISKDEVKAVRKEIIKKRAELIFRDLDKNHDGKISKDECPSMFRNRGEKIDSDSDQSITKEELIHALTQPAHGSNGSNGSSNSGSDHSKK